MGTTYYMYTIVAICKFLCEEKVSSKVVLFHFTFEAYCMYTVYM